MHRNGSQKPTPIQQIPVEKTPEVTDNFRVVEESAERVQWHCGHSFATRFKYDFYGEIVAPNEKILEELQLCGDCILADIKKHTIRCGMCGFMIWPGDGLAGYCDDPKIFTHRNWITFFEGNVIGCMQENCCPSGGFFFGNWNGKEIVPRFASGASVAAEVMRTGKPVFGNTEL